MKAVGIAPGRLDFLGGVADYSGSLVLEMPLTLATRVGLAMRAESGHEFQSVQLGRHLVRRKSTAAELPDWVRYPYGCLVHFCAATGWQPKAGLLCTIDSTVPLGMGVSSSAAIEVATPARAGKIFGPEARAGRAGPSRATGGEPVCRRTVRSHGPADVGLRRAGRAAADSLPAGYFEETRAPAARDDCGWLAERSKTRRAGLSLCDSARRCFHGSAHHRTGHRAETQLFVGDHAGGAGSVA
ncbi:MAG: hypothetical protein WDM96_03315 [Lacunisphaera sp.]